MRNKPLHIACAVDDSFSYPLSVLLVSCLENHKHCKLKIHLFSASFSDENLKKIQKLVSQYGQDFRFYKLNKVAFKGLPVKDRISEAAYYRVLIPENIEENVERYIYLDADMIVLGNLEPLFKLDLNNKIIAAVNDVAAIDMKKHLKHSIPEKNLYFNSGVLLVDKKRWLETNAGERVLQYRIEKHDICDFLDQDGFNGALFAERLELPPLWNQQVGLFYVDREIALKSYKEETAIKEAKTRPAIVHFNGREKPWNQVSAHPFQKSFNKYSRKSIGFKYSEKPEVKKIIKRYLVYGIFGWTRVNRYYYLKSKRQTEIS